MTQSEINTRDVVVPAFFDYWRARRDPRYTFFVLKGGRNSAKSTTTSEAHVVDVLEFPINILCLRKVSNTLEESCFEQIKEATYLLGVHDQFQFLRSPLRIINKARGNGFIFRGGDDTQKMKSIKKADFPIAKAWVEEVTDFKTEDELQVFIDSILRGNLPDGLRYQITYTYNPPRRKQHWLNKKYETQFLPANTYVHHSTYLDNPHLSQQTLEVIENEKRTNFKKYEWNYLGKVTGGGIVPFDNLNFRAITDDELKSFDNIRQGLDWGYATDPLSFVRMHYDKTRRRLYFLDEFYGVKISNRSVAEWLKSKKYEAVQTIADSAEPKSIAELRDLGVRITGARKGEGSVEYGEKWLDDLSEIVIDPKRTPNTAKEFEAIDYKVDKDGNQTARLEDKDNHSIDATRYGCENDMSKNGVGFFGT